MAHLHLSVAKLLIFLEKPRFHFLCNTSQRESVGNKLNNVDSDCGEDSPPVAAGLQHCWHLGPGSVGEEAEACRQAARLLGPHVGATRPHQEGLVVRCQALWPRGKLSACPSLPPAWACAYLGCLPGLLLGAQPRPSGLMG